MRGKGGRRPSAGTFPEHLKTAIDQQADFVAEYKAGFVDARVLTGAVLNDRADAIANDLRLAWSGGTGAEAQLSEAVDSFGEGELVKFLSAKEHALTIMPECGFSRRWMKAPRVRGRRYTMN